MRGQATLEYLAALLLVALVLAAGAVAVAAPGVPAAIVAQLRHALCIVGADVCSQADAAARGLEPCVVAEELRAEETGASVTVIRIGDGELLSVSRLSDGTILLSHGSGVDIEGTTGLGFHLGPVEAGGSLTGGAGFRRGRTWAVSEAQLRRVLKDPELVTWIGEVLLGPPLETFLEGGGSGAAALGVEAIRNFPGAGAGARAAIGRRKGRGGTTYYLDLGGESSGPITEVFPALEVGGRLLAEYRASSPPVLTLRASGGAAETILRLPLRTPGDVAAARRVAFLNLHDPTLAMRDLVARVRERGTVERRRYRTTTETGGLGEWGLDLGVKLGFDHATSTTRRELVEAEVVNGRFPARREDCLSAPAPR